MNPIALSAPVARKTLHTRTVKCNGYKRDDDLYDIEGHLVDVKSVGFYNMDRGDLKPGDPIHEMWIRLTVDLNLNVVDVEAKTVWGPYALCGDITPNFKRLKGLSIKKGWTRKTRELLGGTKGCTHLVELLGPVATGGRSRGVGGWMPIVGSVLQSLLFAQGIPNGDPRATLS